MQAATTALRRWDVNAGDRVAWYLPRSRTAIVLFWALMRVGAMAVPLSTRTPPEGTRPLLDRVDASHLITDAAAMATVAERAGVRAEASAALIGGHKASEGSRQDLPLDRPATIIFTSGSTGDAKAALHTWGNHYFNARGSAANIPVTRGDRWLLSLPLYHVGGLAIVVRCALGGAAVVVPADDRPLAEACAEYNVTHASVVATQLRRLLRAAPGLDAAASFEALLVGGGPVPFALVREAHERGWPVCTTYGCTEMASQVTTTPPSAGVAALRTAGSVLPHREVTIADTGEIWVRGATLFRGYVVSDGLQDPRNEAGWYPTGDLGRFDADGRLQVRGRVDNQFISGGENIQPEEIERALQQLGGVRRAVVVPVPDATYGQRPVAFVDADTEAHALDDWREALAARLPRFKLPDTIYAWPDDPAAHPMKVDRAWFRQYARDQADRD